MATLATSVLTLIDWAKRLDPDGKTAVIVELLSQTNGLLDDMLWKEGNLPTGERTTVRTGLPSVFWRLINQGTSPSKSTTSQVTESVGMLDAWSEVDKDLAELNGNVGGFRLGEAQAFIEAMNQEMASTIFYGNSNTAPEEFTGFAPRYNSLSGVSAQNVVSAAGAGSDNSSVWLVGWGAQTCFGLFPKGSKAGIEHEDLGLVTVETTAGVAGSRMRAYQDHFIWKAGICVKDWRYVARLCNIDISNLVAKSSAADLQDGLIRLYHRIPNPGMAKLVYYMNRSCFQMLDIQRRDDVQAAGMTYNEVDGKLVPSFRGIPIKICDALTEGEAAIS